MPQINDNIFYYFFSTSAQSVAGIAGLLGAMLVFRYQGLTSERESKTKETVDFFSDSEILYQVFSAEDAKGFISKVTTAEKASVIRNGLRALWSESETKVLDSELRSRMASRTPDLETNIHNFRSYKEEFIHFDHLTDSINELRNNIIKITGSGLVLVLLAIACLPSSIFWPEQDEPVRLVLISIYLLLLIIYLFNVVKITRQIFPKLKKY